MSATYDPCRARRLYRASDGGEALEFEGEAVHPPRPGGGNFNGLGKHAAGLAGVPTGIDEIDVESEDHARLETIADDFHRLAVGGKRMVPETGIFQGGEPMAMNAGFTDGKAAGVNLVLDGHQG